MTTTAIVPGAPDRRPVHLERRDISIGLSPRVVPADDRLRTRVRRAAVDVHTTGGSPRSSPTPAREDEPDPRLGQLQLPRSES